MTCGNFPFFRAPQVRVYNWTIWWIGYGLTYAKRNVVARVTDLNFMHAKESKRLSDLEVCAVENSLIVAQTPLVREHRKVAYTKEVDAEA